MPFTEINNVQLYYEANDYTNYWEKGKIPLLLIHGMGVDHTIWRYVVPIFAQYFPTITVDCRGHGRSGKPVDGYEMKKQADDMKSLIEYLQVDSVNVIGTSMGA